MAPALLGAVSIKRYGSGLAISSEARRGTVIREGCRLPTAAIATVLSPSAVSVERVIAS